MIIPRRCTYFSYIPAPVPAPPHRVLAHDRTSPPNRNPHMHALPRASHPDQHRARRRHVLQKPLIPALLRHEREPRGPRGAVQPLGTRKHAAARVAHAHDPAGAPRRVCIVAREQDQEVGVVGVRACVRAAGDVHRVCVCVWVCVRGVRRGCVEWERNSQARLPAAAADTRRERGRRAEGLFLRGGAASVRTGQDRYAGGAGMLLPATTATTHHSRPDRNNKIRESAVLFYMIPYN